MKLIELRKQNYNRRKEENISIELNQDELFVIYTGLKLQYEQSKKETIQSEEINNHRNLTNQILNLYWLAQGEIREIEGEL